MSRRTVRLLLIAGLLPGVFPAQIRTLIVDGQNNHAWKETTPVLKKQLEETGLFQVEVATTPPQGGDMSSFTPPFSDYRLVVLNYNGDAWPAETRAAFLEFVGQGGGVVSYHAADNAFPEWKEYNEIIGVGGWGNRTGTAGSLIRWREGKVVLESRPGNAGNHGARKEFLVTMRHPNHPIAKDLPLVWMHGEDELYDSLRGPAKDVEVVATAFSEKENRGTGEDEPMLMAIRWGKGRIFHTTLGHDLKAISCVGFIATFQRGAEWAATGEVTQKVPSDFPTAGRASHRVPAAK